MVPLGKAVIVLVPTGRVGALYPSSAPAGEPTLSGAPLSPCFAAESTREGTLMSLPEGAPARSDSAWARGGAVSSESDIRVPEAKRGRVPL